MRNDFTSYDHVCYIILEAEGFWTISRIDADTYVAYADLR